VVFLSFRDVAFADVAGTKIPEKMFTTFWKIFPLYDTMYVKTTISFLFT